MSAKILSHNPITPHPDVQPSDFGQQFADFVWRHRTLAGLNRRQLAKATNMDPSYLTLIERHGQVPRRPKVVALGRFFGLEMEALQAAGMTPWVNMEQAKNSLWERIHADLCPEAIKVASQLATRPKGAQRHLVAQLAALLDQQDRQKVANG